jgi:hypothetical protein
MMMAVIRLRAACLYDAIRRNNARDKERHARYDRMDQRRHGGYRQRPASSIFRAAIILISKP